MAVLIVVLNVQIRTSTADDTVLKKIPVILDTDIGDDIDDTWALALLLRCPELDLKLVVGDKQKGTYRAKLIAKMLEIAGRTDVPVGVAFGDRDGGGRQQQWVEEYDLKSYPGVVHEDGVQAIIDTIMGSREPMTLIAIGPVTNLREALQREPRIAEKARFVGMHGSLFKGYNNSPKISPEYNVRADVPACQAVFSAPWEMTITPLDTCGIVQLQGEKYARVRDCKDPLVTGLIENYRIWRKDNSSAKIQPGKQAEASSILFDTVAVYLAFAKDLCKMETLPIRVTKEGMTVVDAKAKKMQVATQWQDLGAFEDLLVERLVGGEIEPK
jgi:inosine-uridine nucleoside N-ribohydrolase